MQNKRYLIMVVFALMLFNRIIFAFNYPPVIYVPVTYYDFHSDRTNPEFEARHYGQLRTGMVSDVLGSDGKPTLGPNPYLNYYLKYWFKSWDNGAKGDYTIPNYNPTAGYKEAWYERDPVLNVEGWEKDYRQVITYEGTKKVDYDTAFKNIVIEDSLPFQHIGNGVYEYKNAEFFPLDNRGFGNEWNRELNNKDQPKNVRHNYSFTMEVHYSFVKVPGMTFDFSGDDDVWVFLNKKLQIDLGGIHEEQQQSFRADNIAGLQNGKSYDLDVFYAERHSAESHIRITTNMIFSPPNLRLYKYPGTPDVGTNVALGKSDSLTIGQPTAIYGHVFDSSGTWKPENDKDITWELIDNNGNPGLNTNKGESVVVTATKPGSELILVAHFKDPNNTFAQESEIRITLYTRRGGLPSPYTLRLYSKSGTPDDAALFGSSVTIKAGETLPVYGHLFDSLSVWKTGLDQYIAWKILESNPDVSVNSTQGAQTSVTGKKAGTFTLVASFVDPTNLARASSEARLSINVVAGSAKRLEIVEKSLPKNYTGDDNFTELIMNKGDQTQAVYAILRDQYDNYTGPAEHAIWRSYDASKVQVSPVQGNSTNVQKHANADGEDCVITAVQDDLSDSLKITSAGSSSIAVSPNPFIPGVTIIPGDYQIKYSNVFLPGQTGTLIGIETTRPLVSIDPSDNPRARYGKVFLYDALGNLLRTDLKLLRGNGDRVYGIIWDGKNKAGRYVGVGTYLIRIKAKMSDGKAYNEKAKIGVKKIE